MRVAAIDIGTNSIRLLVADAPGAAGGGLPIRTVARAGEPCRLGRGLDRSGLVEPAMAEAAAEIVQTFARRALSLGASHIVIGATAALREAGNGPAVAEFISSRTGLPVRIISGEEEARLVYQSVIMGLGSAVTRSSCVVFDIGGGSTEVVSGVGLRPGRWTSLPFGAVNLTERFLATNPPTSLEVENLREAIWPEIVDRCSQMPSRIPVLVGVGGTVTVLALLDRELKTYDPTLIEGWIVEPPRLESLIRRLQKMDQQERKRLPGMGEGRADIVVAGSQVVRLLVQRFPSRGLVCSTQGLRFGLARLAAEEVLRREVPG